jgi:hypothetical protein
MTDPREPDFVACLLQQNGRLDSMKPMPGDSIIIPENLNKGTFMRGLKDWSQVISQFGLAAAAIAVLAKD